MRLAPPDSQAAPRQLPVLKVDKLVELPLQEALNLQARLQDLHAPQVGKPLVDEQRIRATALVLGYQEEVVPAGEIVKAQAGLELQQAGVSGDEAQVRPQGGMQAGGEVLPAQGLGVHLGGEVGGEDKGGEAGPNHYAIKRKRITIHKEK